MHIDIHVHLHNDLVTTTMLQDILNRVKNIQGQETKIMAVVDDVQADVTAQTTVVGSAVTLLQGLKAALDAAGTDPVKLQAIKDGLEANTTSLANAVAANTPAA